MGYGVRGCCWRVMEGAMTKEGRKGATLNRDGEEGTMPSGDGGEGGVPVGERDRVEGTAGGVDQSRVKGERQRGLPSANFGAINKSNFFHNMFSQFCSDIFKLLAECQINYT